MTTATETAEWLDGPALVAWLRDRGLQDVHVFGSAIARAVYRWEHGARANVWAVDNALTQFGFHLSEIPDDLWVPSRTGQKLSDEDVAELLARLDAGEKIKPLAKEFRVSPSTVRFHRDQSRL